MGQPKQRNKTANKSSPTLKLSSLKLCNLCYFLCLTHIMLFSFCFVTLYSNTNNKY